MSKKSSSRRLPLALLAFVVIVLNQFGLVSGQILDPVGDLFDGQGRPVVTQPSAEPCVDIVGVQLVQSGAEYRARIMVNGPIPSRLGNPAIFIEWDLLVDVDQDSNTHAWGSWPLIDNGIGVDLLIRLTIGPRDEEFKAEVRDFAKKTAQRIEFRIDGATVELIFGSSLIGNPMAFDYVFAVRKYGEYGRSDAVIACDKAPNQRCLTFSNSKDALMSVRTSTTTGAFGLVQSNVNVLLGLALVGCIALVGVVALRTRRGRSRTKYPSDVSVAGREPSLKAAPETKPVKPPLKPTELKKDEEKAAAYLARLEELRQRGEISDATYQKLRQEFMRRVGK